MSGVLVPAPLLNWFVNQPISRDRYPPGLYLGQSGIAWVLAELGYLERAVAIASDARRHDLLWSCDNMLHGCTGFGMAALKMWLVGCGPDFLESACAVGEHLMRRATEEIHGSYWRDHDGVPLGYPHGGSGIALFLLYLHLATGEGDYLELGRPGLPAWRKNCCRVTGGV